jgi:uncharacterized protein (DUF1684 family)
VPKRNEIAYHGPDAYALADWRRRVNMLYEQVRSAPSPHQGWQIWRETRDDLFRSHPMSPLPADERQGFAGVPVYDYDEALRFAVDLEPIEQPETITFELGVDGAARMRSTARTSGLAEWLGGELTLYWIEGYGGGLFLPIADATNGSETYGGGRYLIDSIKGADTGLDEDGRLIVDFNFAYNPSCSYSPAFVCPLAPAENRLAVPIKAGERLG